MSRTRTQAQWEAGWSEGLWGNGSRAAAREGLGLRCILRAGSASRAFACACSESGDCRSQASAASIDLELGDFSFTIPQIPEPSTGLLLGLGLIGLALNRCRRVRGSD